MPEPFDDDMWQGWTDENNKILYIEETLEETLEETEEAQDFGFIDTFIKQEIDRVKKEREQYVYLGVLADKLEVDRSQLRRFVLKEKIPMVKIKGLGFNNNRLNLALTQENAKKVIELKLGTRVVNVHD